MIFLSRYGKVVAMFFFFFFSSSHCRSRSNLAMRFDSPKVAIHLLALTVCILEHRVRLTDTDINAVFLTVQSMLRRDERMRYSVRFLEGAKDLSISHIFQNGSCANPVCYQMFTACLFSLMTGASVL
jgi:hypothetical protein